MIILQSGVARPKPHLFEQFYSFDCLSNETLGVPISWAGSVLPGVRMQKRRECRGCALKMLVSPPTGRAPRWVHCMKTFSRKGLLNMWTALEQNPGKKHGDGKWLPQWPSPCADQRRRAEHHQMPHPLDQCHPVCAQVTLIREHQNSDMHVADTGLNRVEGPRVGPEN